MLRDNASDTTSLASFSSQHQNQWSTEFVNIIYKACDTQNPGLAIDCEAVFQIRDTIVHILNALLELKASTVVELDRRAGERIIPKICEEMRKEAWTAMERTPHIVKQNKLFAKNKPHELHTKMVHLVKESHPNRGKDKKDRVTEKELDRMAVYLNSLCETIVDDILKWTGNYVRNIRGDTEPRINLQNLKIAMNSDKALIGLTSSMQYEEDDNNGFLAHVYDFKIGGDDEEDAPKMTYESIAKEFLKDERLYLRELKQINVFRKRLYDLVDDKSILKKLFGNYNEIYEITIKMERLLEDYIETSDSPSIGFGIMELVEVREFDSYLSYVIREIGEEHLEIQPFYIGVQQALNELFDPAKFPHIFDKGTEYIDSKSFRMTLQYVLPELLRAPVLHFYHYVEYVTKLLESTNSGEDRQELEECKRHFIVLGNKLERSVGQALNLKALISQDQAARSESQNSRVLKLRQIEANIDGFVGNPIAKTCLALNKEGELQMVRPSYSGTLDQPLKGKWATNRYCYLFDQMLLLCKKHKNTKYKDRFPTQLIATMNLEDSPAIQNSFRIEVSAKPEEEKKLFTFICKSQEEKDAWMLAFIKTTTKSLLERQVNYNDKEEAKKYPLVIPTADQYRFAEPDCDENITFEDYTSNSGVPVVKSATIIKLVERLTYHQYTDNKFLQTFLISFRSFCSPQELLKLLEERFSVPEPKLFQEKMRGGPLMGRYDTVQSHGLSSPQLYNDQALVRFRKEYERPIQRNVLSVLMQWVKNHYYDFSSDADLLNNLKDFLSKSMNQGKLVTQHKKFCNNILTTIERQKYKNATEKQPTTFDFSESATRRFGENHFHASCPEVLWHTAKKGDIANYDLLSLHPLEVGRQLTLLHFDLYKAVKPIELVEAAWMKHNKHVKSPQLLKLTDHTNMLIYWVSRSIVETENLEERVALMSRVIEVGNVFEELHNFTGLVAFSSALKSASVHRLAYSKELVPIPSISFKWFLYFRNLETDFRFPRPAGVVFTPAIQLSREKNKRYEQLDKLCGDRHWKELHTRLKNINPPCVPFFGMYMTEICYTTENNSTFVKSPISKDTPDNCSSPTSPPSSKPKKVLVSFFKCRRISEIIREIQMYQNQPYTFQPEPTIRQFFESINPKDKFETNEDLEEYLFECSKKIEPKDGERPNDSTPRHPAHVLKSPGIKPPKTSSTSSSSRSYSTQTSTAPSTPSFDSADTPRFNNVHHQDDMAIASQRMPTAEYNKTMQSTFGLTPPPLPRKTITKAGTPPTSLPLTRRQTSAMSPPAAKTPSPSPLSGKRLKETPAFVFPSVHPHESPLLPPKRSPPPIPVPSPSSSDTLVVNQQVVLKNGTNIQEPHSPSVRMVVPLHPPKIPPRIKKDNNKPPELPPKTYKRMNPINGAASTTSSSLTPSPNLSPPAFSSSSTSSTPSASSMPSRSPPPPPLPPKTYKRLPSVTP